MLAELQQNPACHGFFTEGEYVYCVYCCRGGIPVGSGLSGDPASGSGDSSSSSSGSPRFRSTAAGGNDWWSQLEDQIAAGLEEAATGVSGAAPIGTEGGSTSAGVSGGGTLASGEVQGVGTDQATDLVAGSSTVAPTGQGAGEEAGPVGTRGGASDIVASVLAAANAALAERANSIGDKFGGRKLLQSIQVCWPSCYAD